MLIVAEVRMHREGLAAVLGAVEHFEVVGALGALPADLAELAPDIVSWMSAVRNRLRRSGTSAANSVWPPSSPWPCPMAATLLRHVASPAARRGASTSAARLTAREL